MRVKKIQKSPPKSRLSSITNLFVSKPVQPPGEIFELTKRQPSTSPDKKGEREAVARMSSSLQAVAEEENLDQPVKIKPPVQFVLHKYNLQEMQQAYRAYSDIHKKLEYGIRMADQYIDNN